MSNINNYEPSIIAEKIKKECMRQNITIKTMLKEITPTAAAAAAVATNGGGAVIYSPPHGIARRRAAVPTTRYNIL